MSASSTLPPDNSRSANLTCHGHHQLAAVFWTAWWHQVELMVIPASNLARAQACCAQAIWGPAGTHLCRPATHQPPGVHRQRHGNTHPTAVPWLPPCALTWMISPSSMVYATGYMPSGAGCGYESDTLSPTLPWYDGITTAAGGSWSCRCLNKHQQNQEPPVCRAGLIVFNWHSAVVMLGSTRRDTCCRRCVWVA
jgi:hypothetical protein